MMIFADNHHASQYICFSKFTFLLKKSSIDLAFLFTILGLAF